MNAVTVIEPQSNVDAYRASTDAAGLCREIVVATASQIQGRHYVSVEGWQAIATAHGCVAAARDVERVEGGVRAIGEVRRMCDGTVISAAEGFVGEDEPTWFGGQVRGKTLPKRPDYAIRAMAQTRAMSRACRSAFAHVVVMMKAGLSTTPAEEVPHEGFDRNTGEIIENPPATLRDQLEQSVAMTDEPPNRAKLEGKYPSKAKLKEALHAFGIGLGKVFDIRTLDAYCAEYKDAIEQCKRDLPVWWKGDGTDEKKGIERGIQEARESLEGMTGALINSLFACETIAVRDKWMVQNGDAVEGLDGPDRRRFDAAWDAHEAHLTAQSLVTSG